MSKTPGAYIVEFPKWGDARGSLTALESERSIPFPIRRVYYLYDIPGGASRGGHAHRRLEQILIAVVGSFDVICDDGFVQRRFQLNRADRGLYLPVMIWRELTNFSSGGVCLVLASDYYDEEDYIRSYAEFSLRARGARASV